MNKGCLVQCSANYMPLSPITFLERAAVIYGDKVSIVYGDQRFSWKETHQRCFKVASAFVRLGISRHDVVAAFAPNIPALYELHFSVPMAGAILCALNIRLDSPTLSLILQQLEAKAILVDHQHIEVVLQALDRLSQTKSNPPLLILIPEFDQSSSSSSPIDLDLPPGTLNYNDLLQVKAEPNFQILRPNNECDPISVSYTSGSTGNPKGVLYSHRSVYLNSLAAIFQSDMRKMPVFLWTVEMFRCNGWCFPWAVAALGGTNICLRNVSDKLIFEAIHLHKEEVVVDPVRSTQMESECNIKNSLDKRILEEYNEIKSNPSYDFTCLTQSWNKYEWQYAIRGPSGTEFEDGIYHGMVQFSVGYPSKPPSIVFLKENGLSLTAYWEPSLGVRNFSFRVIEKMLDCSRGELVQVENNNKEARKDLAINSRAAPPKYGTADRDEDLLSMSPVPEPSPVTSQASNSTSSGRVVNISGNTFNVNNSQWVGFFDFLKEAPNPMGITKLFLVFMFVVGTFCSLVIVRMMMN